MIPVFEKCHGPFWNKIQASFIRTAHCLVSGLIGKGVIDSEHFFNTLTG